MHLIMLLITIGTQYEFELILYIIIFILIKFKDGFKEIQMCEDVVSVEKYNIL